MRFREWQDNWIQTVLKNVITNNSRKYNPVTDSIEYKCIELESIDQGSGILLSTFNSKSQKSIKNKFSENSVLFGKLRPYLRKFYNSSFCGVCSSEFWVLESKTLDKLFLYYFIQNDKFLNLANISCGSKMPRADWSIVSNGNIYYPSSKLEQIKIGKFLAQIDQRIETQSKIIEEYKCIEKHIIDSIFSDLNDNKLLAVISEISIKNKKNIEYEVLSISNKYGFIKQSEQFEDYEVASSNKSNYKIVQYNDFAYNPARINVGSIARLDKFEIGIISPMYICFKSNSNILPEYLELFFNSSTFKTQMLKKLEGSVRQCLSFDALCSIKLHIISINEQFGIIKKLNFLKQKIELESSLLNKYLCQKKYLLANMFI